MSMTTLPHERIEELVVADALNGLELAERDDLARLIAEHGPDCADCAELVAVYAEVAGSLAMSLDPVALWSEAEERLLARAMVAEPSGPISAPPPAPTAEATPPAVSLDQRRRAPGRGRRWVAAVAAAAVVAVGAGSVGYVLAPKAKAPQVVAFPASDGQQLSVVRQPGSEQAFIVGTVAPVGEGQVYELWFRRTGSEAMEPAGIFVPQDGVVNAEVTVGEEVDLLAVTIEPGFQPQPTTDPIFVAEVR